MIKEIPKQLKQPVFRFVLLGEKSKAPFEKDWQKTNNYKFDDSRLLKHISKGGNVGIIGGKGRLVILDADKKEFAEELLEKLDTFVVKTGSGGSHFYLRSDYSKNHVLKNGFGELRSKNYQVVIAGSTHPNGQKYVAFRDKAILEIKESDLLKIITPYLRETSTTSNATASNTNKTILDRSRSGQEMRECIKLIASGLSKDNVFKKMKLYAKWSTAPHQYKNMTYDKALKYYERKKLTENKPLQKISFNYESILQNVKNLGELKSLIEKNFPDIWFETKVCLALICSLSLKNLNGCPSLILVGNPSGEKTTIASFFYGYMHTYLSDDFTPRAFVSHAVNVSADKLKEIDLLPKLVNKMLITPELAPLFEAPRDKMVENFATLTRVLDGEGYNKDTGAQGQRGYSGDYKFAWLGATTPLRSSCWNVMGKIGNRLFFLNMSKKKRKDEDYIKMFSEEEYEEKIKISRGAVKSFLENYFKKKPIRSFVWKTKEQDTFQLKEIIKYAKLLSKLRGSLVAWKSQDDKNTFEHTFPIIEDPPRAINALRNIARGHALLNGRDYLDTCDIEVVRRVCLSSMPYDRYQFLKLLIKHKGRLSTEIIQKELRCSDETARKTMKTFEVLGVVTIKSLPIGDHRPMHYVEIKKQFKKLIRKSAQGHIGLEKGQAQKHIHKRGGLGLEKAFPSKTYPPCDDLVTEETIYEDQDLLIFISEKGEGGYPMEEFSSKYGEDRLQSLLKEGQIIEFKAGFVRCLE